MRQSDLFGASAQREVPHNLFFALVPDEATRKAIRQVATAVQASAGEGRALNPERYHMTLQYLGAFAPLDPRVVAAACQAADSVALPAFELVLDTTGAFASAKVWWLGSHTVPDGLRTLWATLNDALARHGVKPQSRSELVPHVTLRRETREAVPTHPFAPIHWRVDALVLIDGEYGQPYKPVRRWPLR